MLLCPARLLFFLFGGRGTHSWCCQSKVKGNFMNIVLYYHWLLNIKTIKFFWVPAYCQISGQKGTAFCSIFHFFLQWRMHGRRTDAGRIEVIVTSSQARLNVGPCHIWFHPPPAPDTHPHFHLSKSSTLHLYLERYGRYLPIFHFSLPTIPPLTWLLTTYNQYFNFITAAAAILQ